MRIYLNDGTHEDYVAGKLSSPKEFFVDMLERKLGREAAKFMKDIRDSDDEFVADFLYNASGDLKVEVEAINALKDKIKKADKLSRKQLVADLEELSERIFSISEKYSDKGYAYDIITERD